MTEIAVDEARGKVDAAVVEVAVNVAAVGEEVPEMLEPPVK
jgi:hypothetical protein